MKYDSIINLPHYEPKYHKRMSKMQRAAQFNPFSALTGYDDMVKEVSRVVNERIEISEDKKEEINNKLNFLIKNNKLDSFVSITYLTLSIPFSFAFSSILWQNSSTSSKLKISCKL